MASSLMWRTGQEIVVPVPNIKEVPAMKQETVEGMGEMPEIIVVSDAVQGISQREPVQQRTPEQIEDAPQSPEETADVVELVPRERVQQPAVEETVEVGRLVLHERVQHRELSQERISDRAQIVEVPVPQIVEETVGVVGLAPRERMQQQTVYAPTPQVLEATVEVGSLVLHERVQQRTFLSDQEEQLLHSLRNMGREREMRSLEKMRERHDHPPWLWEGFAELIQRIPFRVV